MNSIAAYWDRQPCNIHHSQSAIGSEQWSREITERKYRIENHIPGFAEFPKWRGKKVLEIGCGIGTDTLEFARAGALVTAVDLSPESLRIARMRAYVEEQSSRIDFVEADAEHLALKVWLEKFDLIYSFGVLHHTPNPLAALQQIRLQCCNNLNCRIKLMLYHRPSWKWLCRCQPEAQSGCPVVRWFTKSEARNLLARAGIRVAAMRVAHIFPWKVSEYIQHRYVKAFPWNYLDHRRWEPLLGHHLLIDAEAR